MKFVVEILNKSTGFLRTFLTLNLLIWLYSGLDNISDKLQVHNSPTGYNAVKETKCHH